MSVRPIPACILAGLLSAGTAASQGVKNTGVKTVTVDKRERTYRLHVPPGLAELAGPQPQAQGRVCPPRPRPSANTGTWR